MLLKLLKIFNNLVGHKDRLLNLIWRKRIYFQTNHLSTSIESYNNMCVPTSNSCFLIGYNCKKCLDCKKNNNFCLTVSIISNLYDYMSTTEENVEFLVRILERLYVHHRYIIWMSNYETKHHKKKKNSRKAWIAIR